MGDNELKVDEPPKDKKKRKSTVKKSDLPKEPADPNADPNDPPKETEKPKKKKSEKSEKSESRKQSAVPSEPIPQPEEDAHSPASRKESLHPEAVSEPVVPDVVAPAEEAPVPVNPEEPSRRESLQQVEKPVERKNSTPKRKQSEVNRSKKEKFLEELDEDKLTELKELFELFDLNGDGFIDLADLKLTFASLGRPEVSDEELKNMLAEASNPLDFDSFVMLLGFKTIALDPEETLRSALSTWDYKDSGLISEERIKHDLMTWGDKFNKAEAEGAFEDAPMFVADGQAMIDYIKFCKTLGGLRKKT